MNGHRYIATLRIFHRRDLSGSLQTILTIPTLPPRSPYHHTAMTRRPYLRPTTYDLRRTYDPLPDIILDLYSIPTSSLSTWVLHIVYIINRSWTSDYSLFCRLLLSVDVVLSFCRTVKYDANETRLFRVTFAPSGSSAFRGRVRTYIHARECLSLEETVIACRNSTPTSSDQSPLLNVPHSIFQPQFEVLSFRSVQTQHQLPPNDRSCVRRDVVGKTADSDIARGLAAIAFTRTVPQAGPINS